MKVTKERAEAFFGVELPTDDFVVAVQKEEMDAGPVKGESRRLTLTYRDADGKVNMVTKTEVRAMNVAGTVQNRIQGADV